jgi:hypothetical protein
MDSPIQVILKMTIIMVRGNFITIKTKLLSMVFLKMDGLYLERFQSMAVFIITMEILRICRPMEKVLRNMMVK